MDLPDTFHARYGEKLTTNLSFRKSPESLTGRLFDVGGLSDGVGGGGDRCGSGGRGGINLRGADSIKLLDECSKQAASMWGDFEDIMPTKEHKEEREKADRKSILCTLLNNLLKTENRLCSANIDCFVINSENKNTITKLSF